MKPFSRRPPPGADTRVSIAKHPLHPILVPFPVAFLMAVFASDLAYWHWADSFWARMSLWLAGAGAVTGIVAGLVGTAELMLVRRIRHRAAAWSHFVAAVMLLAVGVANWGLRLPDAEAHIVPFGMYLSGLGTLLVALAGWLGGTLVFEHQVGVADENDGPAGLDKI